MGRHVHAQEWNVPVITPDVNRHKKVSYKKLNNWHIHAQDWPVPAVAQDVNVPDLVIFDLAYNM